MPDRSESLATAAPLAHQIQIASREDRRIVLSEVADLAMIDLRAAADDEAAIASLETALGFALPRKPRTSSSDDTGAMQALWLSVDQWLVVAPEERGDVLLEKLETATRSHHATTTDLSDARAIIRIQGPGAREVVMKGAACDLTGPDCRPGLVRRMKFAEIAAMVHLRNLDPEELDFYVFRSYADYAWRWLDLASRPDSLCRLYVPQDPPAV